jgi:hypothetical protein
MHEIRDLKAPRTRPRVRMPEIAPVLEPSGLSEHDAYGDFIEIVELRRVSAFVRFRLSDVQVRAADDPVVPPELRVPPGQGWPDMIACENGSM